MKNPLEHKLKNESGNPFYNENSSVNPSEDNLFNTLHEEGSEAISQGLESEGDIHLIMGNDADVTEDDLEALGPEDLSMDMGEDEEVLKHRIYPVDFAASDLDVPGTDMDDAAEANGSEDEENNFYSNGHI